MDWFSVRAARVNADGFAGLEFAERGLLRRVQAHQVGQDLLVIAAVDSADHQDQAGQGADAVIT